MSEDLEPSQSAGGVAYWKLERCDGPWLVLIHGAFGSRAHWLPLLGALSSHYRLLLLDLPGHGASAPVNACRSLDETSAHLEQVFAAAGIEGAFVLGVSFGGMVAQQFARQRQDRVLGLLLCMCVPNFDMPVASPGTVLALARLQFKLSSWPRWCRHFAWQASVVPRVQALITAELLTQPRTLRDAIWEAMICSAKAESGYAFSVPVAQITAQRDDRFPGALQAMRRLAERIEPNLRIEISDAGHCAWLEQPAAFAAAALLLLQRMRLGPSEALRQPQPTDSGAHYPATRQLSNETNH